jgi:hypothetical protein
MRVLHLVGETFSDDATGKLSWQAFIGVYLSYELALYLHRVASLSDVAFCALIALLALLLYGPSKNLENFYKGIYGGFRTPENQTNNQTNVGTGDPTLNGGVLPVTDINDADATPAS